MLPATLAHEVRRQVLHYLEATFHMRDPAVEQALRRFFLDPDSGLFKGPWLQLRRPFRLAADTGARFLDLPPPSPRSAISGGPGIG
jgi:DEAD/DEAH box helicase domain-containing protein